MKIPRHNQLPPLVDKLTEAIGDLAKASYALAESQRSMARVQADANRQQQITNFIIRSQIAVDPVQKQRLMHEAELRMDQLNRRSSNDPV